MNGLFLESKNESTDLTRLKKLVKEKNIEYSKNLINQNMLNKIKKETGINFGKQLSQYIITFGYLSYQHYEFYGIVSNMGLKSDMIKQTQYLNKSFKQTNSFIVLENKGDGDYTLVDKNDNVYEFTPTLNSNINPLNLKLFDYIYNKFN